ncbi:MAG: alpha/beta hydrolase [Sulfuricellaceae bacterium]|jgi:dipeptidyl aminopeptidase/acylaminoacyl peptidase
MQRALAALLLAPLHGLIRLGFRPPRVKERGTPADFGLAFDEVSIPTANGKRLFAWFIPPPSNPAPAVVLLHGWGGNAEMMLPLAPRLHRTGYGVLLFDARCHGRSDHDTFASLPRFAEDLEHALDWLARHPAVDPSRLAVLGHSVGAGAALLAASRCDRVAAVVSVAAFAHPESMMRRFLASRKIPHHPLGRYILRHVEKTIGVPFDAIAPLHTIRRVKCPVLLVHGEEDETVPVGEALALREAGENATLYLLPGGGHDPAGEIDSHGAAVTEFLEKAMAPGNWESGAEGETAD